MAEALKSLLDEPVPDNPTFDDLDLLMSVLESSIAARDLDQLSKSGDLKLALHRSCKITSRIRNALTVGPELE